MTDDGAHIAEFRTLHAQQVLLDGHVLHVGHNDVRVGVQQVQHGGNIPCVGVFKGQHTKLGVAVLHSVKHLGPGGKGSGPGKGKHPPQGNVAPCALHALISGGVAAQSGPLVGAGDGHGLLQKRLVIRAQFLVLQPGRVAGDHIRLPRGIKYRLAGLGFVTYYVGNSLHAPLKQSGHFGVDGIDLGTGLLQKIHTRCSFS